MERHNIHSTFTERFRQLTDVLLNNHVVGHWCRLVLSQTYVQFLVAFGEYLLP